MRIAVGQLDCPVGDTPANEQALLDAVGEARNAGADLFVGPELQLCGYAVAEAAGETARPLAEVGALLRGTAVDAVVGFHERDDEATYNTAAWFHDGQALHVHRKLYLCDYPPFDEQLAFRAGDSLRAFDTPVGRSAILVCNDAWQPFLPALAAYDGAELLIVPAASSTEVPEAETYWRDLTRFYARMLECWVVFANQSGTAGRFTFWGGSHVVDPYGEVVAEAGADETLLVADVEPARASRRRRELPLLRDLRPEVLAAALERFAETART